MILFLGRYLIGVLECHQLTPPNKIDLFLAKHLPPIYDRRHNVIEINSESEFQQPADWNGVINQIKKYGM